jgi:hypothetical protein
MEAEYNALSMVMRDVLPLRNLAIEISKGVGMSGNAPTTFKTSVWEDNNPNDPELKSIWSTMSLVQK